MRKGFQLFFLTAFFALFFLNGFLSDALIPPDIYLRTDPLLGISAAIASRALHYSLVPAMIMVVLTVAAGRVFCGFICPLGTLFDLARVRSRADCRLRRAKYYLLAAVVTCALLGLNLAWLLDPIALLTRGCAVLLYPLVMIAGNAGLDLLRTPAELLGQFHLSRAVLPIPLFAVNALTLLLLAAAFTLNAVSHRYWCASLCPLGALLGLLARCSPVRRRVSSDCIGCMKCAAVCPTAAVPDNPRATIWEECIVCSRCSPVCPVTAIGFSCTAGSGPIKRPSIDLSRRAVLLSAGAGVLAAVSARGAADGAGLRGGLIRPPGAVPEELFLRLCVRCGQCLKVCPTNTLQPCFLQSGLAGLWSPRLWPRHAGCDQTCSLCGRVCPTEAIRPLPLEEKQYAKLGTAFIDTDRCLVWARDRLCLICDEQCPYNAIVFRWQDGFRRPFVVENRCNGCGFCEEQCPVEGVSAIRVTAEGQIRLQSGSYREAARRLQLQIREDYGDDRFFQEQDRDAVPNPEKLPGGFLPE